DSLPATITTQGTWCLRKDLSTAMSSGNAITIATNNVTIDCNDFKIGGLAAGPATTATGIHSTRLNTTARQCNVRGFAYGVSFLGDGGGHVVEDNRLDGNTVMGLQVQGDGSVVRRNRITDTGGSTFFMGFAYGISTYLAVDVLDNTISGVLPSASGGNAMAYGIHTTANSSGSISGNRVRGLVRLGNGSTYGIVNTLPGRISLRDNDVSGNGDSMSIGLYCQADSGSSKDNIISGFHTGISNCTNDGGNVIKP
ncbi:MAG TPA: hypothetical protein VGD21_12260, partial [Lysobacter sp.]